MLTYYADILHCHMTKSIGIIHKNLTLAARLYQRAGELESVYATYGLSWTTTLGIAPKIAQASVVMERFVLFLEQYDWAGCLQKLTQREELSDTQDIRILYVFLFAALLVALYYIWVVM